MKAIDKSEGRDWVLWHGDTVDVARGLPDRSVDFSVFSPPFVSLYTYSASERDMGNCRSSDDFWGQYEFLLAESARVMRPGRLVAIHCMQLPTSKAREGYIGLKDFRGDIIRAYQRHGFIYHSEVCIWKDPVVAMQRTKALGLLHKQLRKDAAMSRQGIADYLVVMRTPGTNDAPVSHENDGLRDVERWQRYASPVWAYASGTDRDGFAICTDKQVAGDTTSGINPTDTLQFRSAREHEDERHVCPLQLEVIRRAIRLWSNPDDIVWSPFAGIGSEGYVALEEKRRFVGAELKSSYYRQAAKNLASAATGGPQASLFDATA